MLTLAGLTVYVPVSRSSGISPRFTRELAGAANSPEACGQQKVRH
jgi:hypothetical protein